MGPCSSCIYVHVQVVETKGMRVVGKDKIEPQTEERMECHRYPPSATPIIGPGPQGPVHMGTLAIYPPCGLGCGEWHPKVAVLSIGKETRQ